MGRRGVVNYITTFTLPGRPCHDATAIPPEAKK